MALRGTGFAKRAAGAEVARNDAGVALPGAEPTIRVVPLDLMPLLAPYRGHGRISLRVERLPHRTRLSRGQNNGDRSWSLSWDELDRLNYLAPDNLAGPQTLSIRVVSLDGGDGATVAVFEYTVPAPEGAKLAAIDGALKLAGSDHAAVVELTRELAEARAALKAQESEFAAAREALAKEWKAQSVHAVESELTAARLAWESELNSRLAAMADRNKTDTEWHRKSWQAEQDTRLAEAKRHAAELLEEERERGRRDVEEKLALAQKRIETGEAAKRAAEEEVRLLTARLQSNSRTREAFEAELAKAQTAWKDAEASRLAEAEARWKVQYEGEQAQTRAQERKEFESELARAQAVWQEREAARLADARAEWQAQNEKALGDARTRAANEVEALHANARSERLKEESARLLQVEAAWRQQLAGAVADARAQAASDAEAALEQAQRAWKANEAARFAAAEARWREESAKLAAEARTRAAGDGKTSQNDQLNRLQDELALANAAVANRDAELARAKAEVEAASERTRSQITAALAEAQNRWNAEESARRAAAEAAWREQTANAQSVARDEGATIAGHAREDARRIGEELARAQAALAERDAKLAEARQTFEAEGERLREENQTALAEARRTWQSEEEARLTAAEESWRAQFAASLAEQTTAQEQAPAPPAEPNESVEDADATRSKVEILRLHAEVERLKALTAVRDVELAQARASAERARARLTGELHDDSPRLRPERVSFSRGRSERSVNAKAKRPLWRDMAIVAVVAAFVILLFPHVVALLPSDWIPGNSYADEEDPAPAPPRVVRPHPPAPPPLQPTDIVIRTANVRSGPAKTESLVTTLPADAAVVTLERRDSWAHIQFLAADGKTHDGWVFSTFLKAAVRSSVAP